jgi:CheY-like chemotaxis protein
MKASRHIPMPVLQRQGDGENFLSKISSKSRRIGIVEDNRALLELYQAILKYEGHDIVFLAHSGEELVRTAKEEKLGGVEVLITDNNMARISGLEAARIVKKHYPDILVIIASAEDSELEKETLDAGFVYLRKPFSISKLAETVLE